MTTMQNSNPFVAPEQPAPLTLSPSLTPPYRIDGTAIRDGTGDEVYRHDDPDTVRDALTLLRMGWHGGCVAGMDRVLAAGGAR